MMRTLGRQGGGFWAGLAVGGLFALGVVAGTVVPGYLAAPNADWRSSEELPPELSRLVTAAGADSTGSLCMATGSVSDEAEGIFVLDGESGDLNCWVFYRMTGNFGAQFKTNVLADIAAPPGKKPQFTMVIGTAEFLRGSTGGARPARSICYVGDGNTGNVVAYGIVFNQTLASSGSPQLGPMAKLGQFSARNVAIRNQD